MTKNITIEGKPYITHNIYNGWNISEEITLMKLIGMI